MHAGRFCRTWLCGFDLCDVSCGVRHDGFHPFLKQEMDDFDAEKITARPREMSRFPCLDCLCRGRNRNRLGTELPRRLVGKARMRVAIQRRRVDDPSPQSIRCSEGRANG